MSGHLDTDAELVPTLPPVPKSLEPLRYLLAELVANDTVDNQVNYILDAQIYIKNQ